MKFGFSRDDIGGFVPDYVEKKLLPVDRFQVIDRNGVGKLVEIGVRLGRKTRRKLKIQICSERAAAVSRPQPRVKRLLIEGLSRGWFG